MIKNLFDFATKELSQDAFLRWLFENYNCENESVRKTCRILFDSFTENKFANKEIKDLVTVAQWKNVDVSIWFEIDGIKQLIVIEDKAESGINGNQLERYGKEIIAHNDFWRKEENRAKYKGDRYIETNGNIFKIFYKTNVVDEWEKSSVEALGWKSYDIYAIYELFKNIGTDNEVLGYYIEHIKKIHFDATRGTLPSEWNTIAWHTFFDNYRAPSCISEQLEINHYRRKYFYIKLFVKGHEKDLPCFEIRSRNFTFDTDSQKYKITVRAVLYNLSEQASREVIELWQQLLKNYGFRLNYKSELSKHKQIGSIEIGNIENNEQSLIDVLNQVSLMLHEIFFTKA